MKIVSAKEMQRVEQLAYTEGASEEEFMKRAGSEIAKIAFQICKRREVVQVLLLCGRGNNAGDAFVVGCDLIRKGIRIDAIEVEEMEQASELCVKNRIRFHDLGGKSHTFSLDKEIHFEGAGLCVDALLGTGIQGELRSSYAEIIEWVNATRIPVVSIDIPSGVLGDSGEVPSVAVKACCTVALGLPKRGFFLGKGWGFVGRLYLRSFGLDQKYIDQAESDLTWLQKEDVLPFLPEMNRMRHKYQAGYVLVCGGSRGVCGAPMLSACAAMRSGVGLVRLFHLPEVKGEFSNLPYEILHEGLDERGFASLNTQIVRAQSVIIGPGLGQSDEALHLLHFLLENPENKTYILDADALNLLAKNTSLLPPKGSVLTPHLGEMKRLLGDDAIDLTSEKFLKRCQEYACKYHITLVVKGACSYIFDKETIYVCSEGDPGMATAGTGDVLAGIIGALSAQGLEPNKAALLGTWLHARSGRIAAQEKTSYSMGARDMIESLPIVFKECVEFADGLCLP